MSTQERTYTTRAFRLGFEYGTILGEASPREAEAWLLRDLKRMPSDSEIEAFCNGSDDGRRGDRFRLNGGAA